MTRLSVLLAASLTLLVAPMLSATASPNGPNSVQTDHAVDPAIGEAPSPAAPQGKPGSTHARSMAATCYSCHGTDGKSHSAIPPLAGMDKSYFIEQMKDFKSGKREATVMHQHAKGYTDEEFAQMADVFAAIKP